jgi:hypothetical protein
MAAPPLGQVIAPAPPSEYGRAPAPTDTSPAPTPGEFAPPPNPGPVTGYGVGGMQQPPGGPPDPPYTGPNR